ncbi:MAG TPA: DinB family protein [Longimicrobium sp.]
MDLREPAAESIDAVQVFRAALKQQYHAALAMLREAIERCPGELWAGGGYLNPFWRIAYHTLYFTHLYLQSNQADFRPWEHHQTGLQDMDGVPGPPELDDVLELPHRPPQTGVPYTKAELLTYWSLCDGMVDGAVDAHDLLDPECGFSWKKRSRAEHQVSSIRHIQHHTAQLGERLRTTAGIGVGWR